MRKLLLLFFALLTGVSGAWAVDYTGIKLTFSRADAGSGTATANVSDVTVNVTDQTGAAIDGVSASFTSMYGTNAGTRTQTTTLMTGSTSALQRTSNSVLVPADLANNGYKNAQNNYIEYTICVTGLSTDFVYNNAALDVYACTASGAAQGNTGSTVRNWTFNVATGTAVDATTSFVNQTNNDICTVSDDDGGLHHKLWSMIGWNKAATANLYIKVTLTKTDGNGCYAGLGEVRLYYLAPVSDLNSLSNAKSYMLTTQRGSLGTDGSAFCSTNGTSYRPSEYAIVSYSGNKYLYSVSAKKFVTNSGTLDYAVTSSSSLTFEDLGSSTFKLKLGSNCINVNNSTYGVVVNSWSTTDAGNTFTITEAEEFDATDALAALKWVDYDEENSVGTATYSVGLGTYSNTLYSSTDYKDLWTSNISSPQLTLRTGGRNGIYRVDGGLYDYNNTAETYTLSVPTGFKIKGYSFRATPSTGATGMKITPEGESAIEIAAGGTDVNVTGLNAQSVSFNVLGRYVQVSNFKVTYTIDPLTYVTDLASLSNDKVYILACSRAALQFSTTAMSTLAGADYSLVRGNDALQIGIMKKDENYYLYSAKADKFFNKDNTLQGTPQDAVTITTVAEPDGNYKWFFSLGSDNNINVGGSNQLVISNYSTQDVGNKFAIIEADDFNSTNVTAAMNFDASTLSGISADMALSNSVGYPTRTSTGYTNLNAVYSRIIGNTSTCTDHANLPALYTAYKNETTVTYPSTDKFYKIYHPSQARYLYAKAADNTTQLTVETDGNLADAIFYSPDGTRFVSYLNGYFIYSNKISNTPGSGLEFTLSHYSGHDFGTTTLFTNGKYYYAHTDNKVYNDSGENTNVSKRWKFEEVTTLPITMNASSGAYYASIKLPVAVEIPEGTLTKVVENGVLAANQPVVLYSKSNVTSLTISNETGTSADGNELEGTIAAKTVTADENYVLNGDASNVGFYKFSGTEMPGFKAYLPSSAKVKAFTFTFNDAETAIRAIENENNGIEIYDMAGRRVPKAQKGLYIVNGKKVMYK